MRGESWDSGMSDQQTAITLQNLQAWARQKWKMRHKVRLLSFEDFLFSSPYCFGYILFCLGQRKKK